jgi:hypothetical protein
MFLGWGVSHLSRATTYRDPRYGGDDEENALVATGLHVSTDDEIIELIRPS